MCLPSRQAVFGTLALAVFMAFVGVAGAAGPTRIVHPAARHGNTAVFKAPPALAATVVGGELVVGERRTPLARPQLRTLGQRGVLRLHVAATASKPALSLRLAARTGTPQGSSGGGRGAKPAPIAVAQAIPASPVDSAFNPLSGGRLYAADSPFNQRLPENPALAPNSSQLVQGLLAAEAGKGFVLTAEEWTVPAYFADAHTPRTDVSLGQAPPQWGMSANTLAYPPGSSSNVPEELPQRLRQVPIPAGALPDPSLDAHMTIIDRAAGCEYDLYGAHLESDGWHAVWANSTRIEGSGVYPYGMGAKASGFASLAGLIWPQELRSGHIDHALFFAYPFTRSGGPVSPATSSDGRLDDAAALPEGARVQLDPSLDLDTLDLRPYQRTIAEAMQKYGMILGDTGGAFSLYAVGRGGFAGNPYQGLLPEEDFPDLSEIPADRFRVLQLPPQSRPPQQVAPSGCGSFD